MNNTLQRKINKRRRKLKPIAKKKIKLHTTIRTLMGKMITNRQLFHPSTAAINKFFKQGGNPRNLLETGKTMISDSYNRIYKVVNGRQLIRVGGRSIWP